MEPTESTPDDWLLAELTARLGPDAAATIMAEYGRRRRAMDVRASVVQARLRDEEAQRRALTRQANQLGARVRRARKDAQEQEPE